MRNLNAVAPTSSRTTATVKLRRNVRRGRNLRRAGVAAAVLTMLPTTLLLGNVAPASAASLTCDTGFYAVSGFQFLGGNPATGSWSTIGAPFSEPYNAIGYNQLDNYVYGIGGSTGHLLRVNSDGSVNDLGAVTGLPAGSYNRGTFDEQGRLWVASNVTTYYAIDVTTNSVVQTLATSGAAIISADIGYYNGTLVAYGGGRMVQINMTTGVRTNRPVISGIPSNLTTNAVWTTASGRVFMTDDSSSATAAEKGIWEVLSPYSGSAVAVRRVDGSVVSGGGDGAACYTQAPPWGVVAEDNDFTGSPVAEDGGQTATVLDNDTVNNESATSVNASATLTDLGGLTGATIDSDGRITIPAGTPAGDYVLTYKVCATATPADCDTATAKITVAPSVGSPMGDLRLVGGLAAIAVLAGGVALRRRAASA